MLTCMFDVFHYGFTCVTSTHASQLIGVIHVSALCLEWSFSLGPLSYAQVSMFLHTVASLLGFLNVYSYFSSILFVIFGIVMFQFLLLCLLYALCILVFKTCVLKSFVVHRCFLQGNHDINVMHIVIS